jgi:hypothetical protein
MSTLRAISADAKIEKKDDVRTESSNEVKSSSRTRMRRMRDENIPESSK